MQAITNDTLRSFSLYLNAKACYALTRQRKVLTLIRNSLKTRHHIIIQEDKTGSYYWYIIRNTLPSGEGSLTDFSNVTNSIYYSEYAPNNERHGLYEFWAPGGQLHKRTFYRNGQKEGVEIDYDRWKINVYHYDNRFMKIETGPFDHTSPRIRLFIKMAQETYEGLLKLYDTLVSAPCVAPP